MSCPFCGAASNPRWAGGYLCGTIDGHQSGLCGSLVRYGERIVMVSEIDALKARIKRLEEYAHGLEVIGDEMKQAALTCDAVKWDAQRARRPQS